jgi:glycosyltransferase 2 family protein
MFHKYLNIFAEHHILKWMLHFIGPAIIAIILFRLNTGDILKSLLSVKPLFMLWAAISQVMSYVLKSERWRVIMTPYCKLSFFQVFKANVYGALYSNVTPARIGEGLKAPLVKSPNISYPQIFFSILVDKFLDIVTMVLAGYLGLIFLRRIIKVDNYILLVTTICLISTPFLVYYFVKVLKAMGQAADNTKGIRGWFYNNLNLVRSNITSLSKSYKVGFGKVLCYAILFNVLAYFFYFLSTYFIVLSLDLNISFFYTILSFSVVALIGILPITISGIGTRDISLIFFFNIVGVSAENAMAASLINLVLLEYGVILLIMVSIIILNATVLSCPKVDNRVILGK